MSKKQTELAKSGTSALDFAKMGQEGIPHLLEVVKAKIAAITKGTHDVETTKGKSLPGFPELSKIDKVSVLVQAHSSVTGKANAYKASAEELGVNLSKFPFKIEGCTQNQWIEDIRAKVIVLMNKNELDNLRQVQKTLEENLSQDEKLKNDLQKVAKMLNDDSPLE